MGIKGLFKVISDHSPGAIRTTDYKALAGRKVAIDASMSLYQFLIAVRQNDGIQLTGSDGETTSHLIGLFHRTIRLVENGIKPIYVFDGKPPDMKGGELKKRLEARSKAEAQRDEHKESGNTEEMNKFERRLVTVTKDQTNDAKKLLRLMGIPVVEAPGEAEAQCAILAKTGKVYGAGSEDMDTLTFGSPVLLRHLTAGDQKKNPIIEVELKKALEGMGFTEDQFIDMCILLGCDYCDAIKGMGAKTAFKLIQEHKSIEKIKEALQAKGGNMQIPDDWPYDQVRQLFTTPDVADESELNIKSTEPDVENLVEFLVKDKGFNEERVRSGAAKLVKGSTATPQGRLTDFFKVAKRPASVAAKPTAGTKSSAKKFKGKK